MNKSQSKSIATQHQVRRESDADRTTRLMTAEEVSDYAHEINKFLVFAAGVKGLFFDVSTQQWEIDFGARFGRIVIAQTKMESLILEVKRAVSPKGFFDAICEITRNQ